MLILDGLSLGGVGIITVAVCLSARVGSNGLLGLVCQLVNLVWAQDTALFQDGSLLCAEGICLFGFVPCKLLIFT